MEPFPIQEMTLPIALMGTDLIGQARTGTGKTLGFGIPLLQRTISPGEPDYEELAAPGKPQALVVTPTRELTIQVAKDLETASTVRTVRVLTIYGGVAYEPQLDQLKKGVDVIVGTPGRLLDLANRGVLDLSHIKVLVLDEADEMLDLGFLPDVERILRKTPELRQTMLFSATMPSAVITLARTHMRHPLNIRAESHDDSQIVPATAQFVYRAHDMDKPEVVARILQAEDRGRVMIFCRTKREASRLTDDLADRGFKAAAIHGDLNQQARERALTRFRGDKIDVLVCTDVAARGIDVEGVTHVVNNTCPEDEKTYIHRIGRTGRAGASGIAVTFVDWADVIRWKTINKALDLPYDEPQEIYSTSPELYHDLGIPTDAKGRIKPAREPEREEKPRREKPARRTEGQETARRTEGEEAGDRSARSKRNRNRRRTRSGRSLEGVVGEATEQVEEKSEADVTAKTQVPPTPESSTEAAEVAQSTERKPRQRTRRRRTSEAADASTTGAAGTTAAGATETAAGGSTEAAPVAEATAVEVATEAKPAESAAEVEGSAEAKPAKRTRSRTRKTAEPKPADAEASAPETAPAEASATESAPAEADAPAKAPAKKTTRARKTAKATAPSEEPATKAAPAEKKPARKAATATKKTAAKAPAPRTAPTIPTFTAPE
ncbi:superfamily II DNA/RNA helicase [Kribbella sp. VKM Ac-2527]|uniref:RNA helicase n=2 Tax=Kribbella caucasensis TaxID=2512215 RepID=A0A4R6JM35_9ACTN|nr:superfamily II DNA/RNA helicase [Kribbella sp. VKM Ac-2527]